jgi:succinyl-CoA synthetase beta subunit
MSQGIMTILEAARAEGRWMLDLWEARRVVEAMGVPLDRAALAPTRKEALAAAKKIGFPVVMKIVSPDVIHKTEVGGVKVNIAYEDELGKAFDAMMESVGRKQPTARVKGVLIEEMVKGTELIIGSSCDAQFGRMLMFGMGGIFVEIYKDVSFRLVPIAGPDALEMIEEIRGKAIFEGARGHPKADKDALARMLVNISDGLRQTPLIEELDINPLMVTDAGLKAVDARILIGEKGKGCPV